MIERLKNTYEDYQLPPKHIALVLDTVPDMYPPYPASPGEERLEEFEEYKHIALPGDIIPSFLKPTSEILDLSQGPVTHASFWQKSSIYPDIWTYAMDTSGHLIPEHRKELEQECKLLAESLLISRYPDLEELNTKYGFDLSSYESLTKKALEYSKGPIGVIWFQTLVHVNTHNQKNWDTATKDDIQNILMGMFNSIESIKIFEHHIKYSLHKAAKIVTQKGLDVEFLV